MQIIWNVHHNYSIRAFVRDKKVRINNEGTNNDISITICKNIQTWELVSVQNMKIVP
jgi:hypothetical protein